MTSSRNRTVRMLYSTVEFKMRIQDLEEEVAFLTEQAKNGKRQNKLLKVALAKT